MPTDRCTNRDDERDGVVGGWRSPTVLVFSMLLFCLGLWLSASVALPHLQHWDYSYSLPVPAQVVESRLDAAERRWSKRSVSAFSYRYIHQGRLFLGTSYRLNGRLAEAVHAHPAGSMLTAYLDPDRPQYAMIWPGLQRAEIGVLVLGLILLLTGVGGIHKVFSDSSASPDSLHHQRKSSCD